MMYRIYEGNVEGLKARLNKLNKRAAKIGATPIVYTVDGEDFEAVEGQPGKMRRIVLMNVTGEAPCCNGWTFIGTLNHTDDGNIIRAVPGVEMPTAYRDCRPSCDHCKTNRLRRDTYIVRNEAGECKQVGSNCLQDFLGGHKDPAKLASWAELVLGAYDICASANDGGRGLCTYRIDLPEYLSYVAEIVLRSNSFVSRKQATAYDNDTVVPTSQLAMNAMFQSAALVGSGREIVPSVAAVELATAAREHALRKYAPHMVEDGSPADFKKSLMSMNASEGLNDFEHNLFVAAKCEGIELRQAGVAAYIIQMYRKDMELIAKRDSRPSNWVGEVGKRLRGLKLTVKAVRMSETMYGMQTWLKFVDENNNTFVWSASGEHDYAIDTQVIMTGTVKEHSDWKGFKQTKLTRCKVEVTVAEVVEVTAPLTEVALAM
jgi:hypothetical protein